MKQYALVQVGHAGFLDTTRPVDVSAITSNEMQSTIRRMIYTMGRIHGVGLAAPQIGLQEQLFVMRVTSSKYRSSQKTVRPYAVCNPHILEESDQQATDWEGCFSVAKAGLFAKVTRPTRITVSYYNRHAKKEEVTLEGLEARIFLHEYEHLHGHIFLEKADMSTLMDGKEYREMRKSTSGA